jgi:hypothetical protein
VLADEKEINPDVLLKLNELSGKGAAILGPKPDKVSRPGPNLKISDAAELIVKLWGTQGKISKQKSISIHEGIQPEEMLRSMNILPDFNYNDIESGTLDFIHYDADDLDFYFIRNTTNEWISRDCSFRQENKIPEIWDPVSGKIYPAAVFSQDNYIDLPVTLAPFGSTFVVFKNGRTLPHLTKIGGDGHPPLIGYTKDGFNIWQEGSFNIEKDQQSGVIDNYIRAQPLEGAWEVFFPKGLGAPARAIFPELISWSDSKDDGIKYFSGIGTYKKTFQVDINLMFNDKQRVYLDLGDLSNIGKVWLNEKLLGVIWTKPYRFDITDVMLPGDNTLIVEIANTWSNRLVGDAIRGEKYTSTNITTTNINGLNKIQVPWAEVPLLKSGLFGPVKVYFIKNVDHLPM